MSEMRYLFPQNKVFPQRKCVVTGLERVVIVCKSHTLIVSAPLGEIRLLPGWSEITQTLVASCCSRPMSVGKVELNKYNSHN